jgi:hypothetical protein
LAEGLSERAYAAHRKARGLPGARRNAVTKALQEGRIHRMENGRIDPEEADRDWAANTSQAKRREVAPASYQEARAIREALNARMTKLDYEERLGQLVPAAEAKKEAFEMGRIFRDRMLAIPGRVAASLAAETDVKRVEAKLASEIRRALEELAIE